MVRLLLPLLFCLVFSLFSLHAKGSDMTVNPQEEIQLLSDSGRWGAIDSIRLERILNLTKDGVLFNDETPVDSVTAWSKQLIPMLEERKEYTHYFELNHLLISIRATRGDLSVAIDKVGEMQKKAKEIHSELGMAIAGMSIADAYFITGIMQDAFSAYKEAFDLLQKIPDTENYQRLVIYQLYNVSLVLNEQEQALYYLEQMEEKRFRKVSEKSECIALMGRAFYNIQMNKGDSARYYLSKIEIDHTNKEYEYLVNHLNHLYARYYVMTGSYNRTLENYDKTLKKADVYAGTFRQLVIFRDKAKLLEKMERPMEACRIYQKIKLLTDSIAQTSYTRQINILRAKYQVDRIELENKTEQNRLLTQSILFIFLFALIIFCIILYIRFKNRKLLEVKKNLLNIKEKAEDSIRSKSIFLSNMSHEIRTPLNVIVGFSSLLSMEDVDDETRKQSNEIIRMNSDLLLKLINDVIDLSRLDLGEMTFNIESCDVLYLCDGVIDTLNKIKQTSAEVKLESSLRSLQIETDTARLQQMLINLLVNATKFTPQGSITLSVEQESPDWVRFAVTDTGSGIPSEKQKQIFERFAKLNEHAQGSGIGLSICQLIIERLGGRIWIDPDYKRGARFIFTHPVKQKSNPTAPDKDREIGNTQTTKHLI